MIYFIFVFSLELIWNNGTSDTVNMTYFIIEIKFFKIKICFFFLFSLIANITGRYWYLESVTIESKTMNLTEYRYFAYGMYSKMDTPPTYSYVCKTATFVAYNDAPKHGLYNFQDKFYITNFQVTKKKFFFFFQNLNFVLILSFNHFMEMVHILVHQIIVHHFLQVEYGWA